MQRRARVDKNQKEIVTALRGVGAAVYHVHQVKGLFDILVCYNNKTYCVEIKDGDLPPSARKLTPLEQECKEKIESTGVKYWIITSVKEAIEMLSKHPYITAGE